jgi:Ca2+-binding EF-hand superfamily protein
MHEFTKEHHKKIQAMFVLADPHGTMLLRWETLHGIYHQAGFEVSKEQFQSMLDAMGEKWNEPLNYTEFFSHMTALPVEMPEIFEHLTSIDFAPTHIIRIITRRMQVVVLPLS